MPKQQQNLNGTEIYVNVIDLETTGFPPNCDIIEIAITQVTVRNINNRLVGSIGDTISRLCKPTKELNPCATAVNHITNDMLVDAQPLSEVIEQMIDLPCDYYCAHNVKFEQTLLANYIKKDWLCTLKIAQQCLPDAPSHKNQVLRYFLNLDSKLDQTKVQPAHRAGPDTYITAALFCWLLNSNQMTFNEMLELTKDPIPRGKITFGKHKGMLWTQVPISYLQWLVKNSKDQAIQQAAKFYINQRRK